MFKPNKRSSSYKARNSRRRSELQYANDNYLTATGGRPRGSRPDRRPRLGRRPDDRRHRRPGSPHRRRFGQQPRLAHVPPVGTDAEGDEFVALRSHRR